MTPLKTLVAILATTTLATATAYADSDVTAERQVAESSFPADWAGDSEAKVVQLPQIKAITSANTFDITAYGASTTSDDNASAIQKAIDAANKAGGGMVVVPAGTWMSGPVVIKSNVVFHINAGATLRLLPFGTYPSQNEYQDHQGSYKDNIFIGNGSSAVNDVIIEGEGETSVIDGQGAPWWKAVEDYGNFNRPPLIRLKKGTRHLFRNFKLLNAPATNLTLGNSGAASHMTAHDITISAPASTLGKGKASHNTDGMPIWGPYVNIYDCYISTGDDNIVCDSNARYIHAWNITCGTGHGMSIGSYTVNTHHIIYEDIDFQGTETGFRIKTSNDRSGNDYAGTNANGSVHDLIFRNSTMQGVRQPILLTTLYDTDPADPSTLSAEAVTNNTPEYRDFLFQNITAENTPGTGAFKWGCPIYIYGRPESYIHDITFDNVSVDAQKGMFLAYCKDINFINGCNIVNTAGTGDFSMYYEASYKGSYNSQATLSDATCSAKKDDVSPWSFDGGYTISNGNGKKYASASTYIKYSADVQYTITLPEGIYVKAVQFTGYDNYEEADAYVSELNGTTFAADEYVFPADKSVQSRKIDLPATASGTLTFTVSGKQCCLALTLYTTDTPSAIDSVPQQDSPAQATPLKVITPDGRLVIGNYNVMGQRVK